VFGVAKAVVCAILVISECPATTVTATTTDETATTSVEAPGLTATQAAGHLPEKIVEMTDMTDMTNMTDMIEETIEIEEQEEEETIEEVEAAEVEELELEQVEIGIEIGEEFLIERTPDSILPIYLVGMQDMMI
jgi:hypothetical protein